MEGPKDRNKFVRLIIKLSKNIFPEFQSKIRSPSQDTARIMLRKKFYAHFSRKVILMLLKLYTRLQNNHSIFSLRSKLFCSLISYHSM